MRDHGKQLQIERRIPVDKRFELHFEPAVGGSENPRRHKVVLSVLLGNMESHFVQFMAFALVKQHIFGRLVVTAESVTYVEPEFFPVGKDGL